MQQPDNLYTIEQLHIRQQQHTAATTQYMDHEIDQRERIQAFFARDPLITNVLFPCPFEDVKSSFDAAIFSAGTWYIIEIKARSNSSTAYSTSIIERYKIRKLQALQEETGVEALWMAVFPDDVAMLWRVNDYAYAKEMECHCKTFEQELGSKDKMMCFYRTAKAIVL